MSATRSLLACVAFAALALAADPPAHPPADRAQLVLRVPEGARVTVNKTALRKTGPKRTFTTKVLERGKEYDYRVVVTWTDSGKERKATRRVKVKAGDRVEVDFRVAEAPLFKKRKKGAGSPQRPVPPE
jgi:uncharacterized protein (TIGR03000 family)